VKRRRKDETEDKEWVRDDADMDIERIGSLR
jgi:hypothetical protein